MRDNSTIFAWTTTNTGSCLGETPNGRVPASRQVVPQSQLYSDPPTPTQNGTFSLQTAVSGLSTPTAIDFDSTGRMFISEQRGTMRVVQNVANCSRTPFPRHHRAASTSCKIAACSASPFIPTSRHAYIYVSYTYDPAETLSRTGARRARRLRQPRRAGEPLHRRPRHRLQHSDRWSEVVLVGTNSTWANISHPELDSTDNMSLAPSGGMNGEMQDILHRRFGVPTPSATSRSARTGKLYVSNGDGASFGRVDPRAARTLSLDSLSGKLLRIDPITGDGLADNPFYNGDPDANRSKVFKYGLRNPFRFAFSPTTGDPYIGDVGWNTWEEINAGRGKNFGWPFYEGGSGVSNQTGGYKDLSEAQTYYASGAQRDSAPTVGPHSTRAAASPSSPATSTPAASIPRAAIRTPCSFPTSATTNCVLLRTPTARSTRSPRSD